MNVVFVTSPAGHIGTQLVAQLLAHPSRPTLILPTRDLAKLTRSLSASAPSAAALAAGRIRPAADGRLADPAYVERVLRAHAVDSVFLNLTGADELFVTAQVLDAARRAGAVRRLVYVSAAGTWSGAGVDRAISAGPHVAVKVLGERMLSALGLAEAGIDWTVLGPALFFGNDAPARTEVMERGAFLEPFGEIGAARVDEADIAAAAVRVFEDSRTWHGKKVMIGSRKYYKANDIAGLWSRALGKEVTVNESNKEGFEKFEQYYLGLGVPPEIARMVTLMFQHFAIAGFGMTETEYREQMQLLGREPSSYEDFVTKTALEWQKSDA